MTFIRHDFRAARLSAFGVLVAVQASVAQPQGRNDTPEPPLDIVTHYQPARAAYRQTGVIDPSGEGFDDLAIFRETGTCLFAAMKRDGTLVVRGQLVPEVGMLAIDTPDGSQTLSLDIADTAVLANGVGAGDYRRRYLLPQGREMPFPGAAQVIDTLFKQCMNPKL